jgi:hypothetical protein
MAGGSRKIEGKRSVKEMNLLDAPREENFDDNEIIETRTVKQYVWSMLDSLIVLGLVFIVGIELGYAWFIWMNKNTVLSNFFLAMQGVVTVFLIYKAVKSIGITDLIVKKINKKQDGSLTFKEQK